MRHSQILNSGIAEYAEAHSSQPDQVLRELTKATCEAAGDWSVMQISSDLGSFLTLLSQVLRPRLIVEVGTFTGYSSICLARGLAPQGRLITCDVSAEWTAVAKAHWEMAGLSNRIELRLGPAKQSLLDLSDDQTIDLAFIDADKTEYDVYYALILQRLSPQGVIVVDNTLWEGNVLPGRAASDPDTLALRSFNAQLAADKRVHVSLLTVSDGVTLITRRMDDDR